MVVLIVGLVGAGTLALVGVVLAGAALVGVVLDGAALVGVVLNGAVLDGAAPDGWRNSSQVSR